MKKLKDFILKHYFIILFIVLIINLSVFLINAFFAKDIIEEYKPNKRNISRTTISSLYDYKNILQNSIYWLKSNKRQKNNDDINYVPDYTDFMVPFPMARSNIPEAKAKLIPYESYKVGVCPITDKKLTISLKNIMKNSKDTDKDGIPDLVEKNLGLDPNNPEDANKDLDNDGFSNIEEFKYNPEGINNPNIHPPLITRLKVLSVKREILPVIFKQIIEQGPNKKNWDIQTNIQSKDRWITKFLSIGSSITLNNTEYKISNIIIRKERKLDPNVGELIEKDRSVVVIKDKNNEIIEAPLNSQVKEASYTVKLADPYYNTVYTIKPNNIIILTTSNGKRETYFFEKVDNLKKELFFKSRNNNKMITLTYE